MSLSGPTKAVNTSPSVNTSPGLVPQQQSPNVSDKTWNGHLSSRVGNQSDSKITSFVEKQLDSPAKAQDVRDLSGNVQEIGSQEGTLDHTIKDKAAEQLKLPMTDRQLRLRDKMSPMRDKSIETNNIKSIQAHFSIKGHPELPQHAARVALRVLQGEQNIAYGKILSDHNIILRTRDTKNPKLEKISLVFKKQHIAEGGFGKIYKSYNLKQGATVTKLGHGNVEENNKEMAVDQNIIEKIRSKAMNDRDLKKLLSQCFVFGKFNKGNQELGQEMPFAQSDLFDAIPTLDGKQKVNVLKQILNDGKLLHQLGFVHRDIKPENVLLVDNDAKLSDFGLTRSVEDVGREDVMGTLRYLAPEVLENGEQGQMQDLWAFGLSILEIIGVEIPDITDTFTENDRLDKIEEMKNQVIELNKKNRNPLYKVIIGLLEKNPEDRMDMSLAEASLLLEDITPESVDNFKAIQELNLQATQKVNQKVNPKLKERIDEIGQITDKEARAILNTPGNEGIYLIRYDKTEKQFLIDHIDPSSKKLTSSALTQEQEKILLEDGFEELQFNFLDHTDEALMTLSELKEAMTDKRIGEIGIMKLSVAVNLVREEVTKKGTNDQLLFYNESNKKFYIANKADKVGGKEYRPLSPDEHNILLEKGLDGLKAHREDLKNIKVASEYQQAKKT